MIPFDFAYFRPDTVKEAVEIYQTLSRQGHEPVYWGGGTEIITLGRLNQLRTKAVIDLKAIPECCALAVNEDKLIIGAAVSITQVAESGLFPLFTESAARIADHTSRCKITVGGNICSRLPYREAVLAFLLTDSLVTIAGPQEIRTVPITDLFDQTLQLQPGEFLVQLITDTSYLDLSHRGVKKTKDSRINYPLVSVTVVQKDAQLRLGITGLCAFPFRSEQLEALLNDTTLPDDERIDRILKMLPAPILDDVEGSAAYRAFVFSNTLHDTITKF